MAIGKNKKLSKGSKRGAKKKTVDPFLKKLWYPIGVPSTQFPHPPKREHYTLINDSKGNKNASEAIKGRVLELNYADLREDEDQNHIKMKFCIEEVRNTECLTDFYGFDITRDKLCSLVKKWQTIVEGNVDIRTKDDYVIRIFFMTSTKKASSQVSFNCYAKTSQIKLMRKVALKVLEDELGKPSKDLAECMRILLTDGPIKAIEKKLESIYPVKDTIIRKVKVLKKPKFDVSKLLSLYEVKEGAMEDPGAEIPGGEIAE